ncbi:MAG: type IX secretion system motor protein PorM/GldM [Mucilaginibacter sp.]
MAGGKQTPRQRMMGILYLVLLGLIALEVPESLMEAFKNIGDSLSASGKNVQTGIDNTFTSFENTKLKNEPERAKVPYAKAKKAKALADDLNAYVESLKQEMITKAGGIDPNINDFKGRENVDISADMMVTRGKAAYDLHKKIDDTRSQLLALLSDKERQGVNLPLEAVAPKKVSGFPHKTWEEANFGEGMPMGAAVTNFIKIQSDTRNSENEVVKKILGEVDQAQVNLDQFAAVAVAPTSYVLVGQPYTAEVFLTAYDSKLSPEITVDGSRIPTEAGKGKYTGNTSSEGIHTWTGKINVKQADGTYMPYTTAPQTYQVAKPSAVVSPDKMLVLYIGLPNPVSVSAPGIAKEKLNVTMNNGSISGSDGHYTATVSTTGTATITVTGKVGEGANAKTVTLGSTEFRVKRIPDPKAQFAGKGGGTTSTANIKAQDALFAKLDGFEFDAKFNVTRFTLLIVKPRQDPAIYSASSGQLTPEMKKSLATITPGTTIVFENIIAVGPDGTQRGLDNIVFSTN